MRSSRVALPTRSTISARMSNDDGSVVRVFLPDAEGSPSSTSMATNTTERAPGAERLHPQLDLRIATRKHSVNRLPNLTHHWSASLEPDRITRRL
jgi:hypothetical protein